MIRRARPDAMPPPYVCELRNRQRGFSLVSAIFIIVILSALSGYMVTMSGMMHSATTQSVQGARAYQAAHSGIEWGIHQAFNNTAATCGAAPNTTVTSNLSLSGTGLNGFEVTVTCRYTSHQEKSATVRVFYLTALGEYASVGQVDYVSRRLEAKVSDTPP